MLIWTSHLIRATGLNKKKLWILWCKRYNKLFRTFQFSRLLVITMLFTITKHPQLQTLHSITLICGRFSLQIFHQIRWFIMMILRYLQLFILVVITTFVWTTTSLLFVWMVWTHFIKIQMIKLLNLRQWFCGLKICLKPIQILSLSYKVTFIQAQTTMDLMNNFGISPT